MSPRRSGSEPEGVASGPRRRLRAVRPPGRRCDPPPGYHDNGAVSVPDGDVLSFWQAWFMKWRGRISLLAIAPQRATPRRRQHRAVRPNDVFTAWVRLFMPATEAEYVMPDWWPGLSAEEKRRLPRPELTVRHRRVRPASEAKPGFSMDDVGRYLKLPDGTVLRDRRSAAHRLWRQPRYAPDLVDALYRRTGGGGRPVKGRTAERVLEALVCRSLIAAGMTQVGAAGTVLGWSDQPHRDPKKLAEENRIIWRELRVPPVSE